MNYIIELLSKQRIELTLLDNFVISLAILAIFIVSLLIYCLFKVISGKIMFRKRIRGGKRYEKN